MWAFLKSQISKRVGLSWRPQNRLWNYTVVEDRVLDDAASRFGVSLVGDHAYGFGRKSAGAVVASDDGAKMWLKVSGLIGRRVDGRREAEAEAEVIAAVPKPKTLRTLDWTESDVFWRATLMTLAPSKSVSRYSWLIDRDTKLDDDWFDALQRALNQIGLAQTQRFIISQDEINLAIHDEFGASTQSVAPDWRVVHGDLQWSNVTAPELFIVDWENWGLAPRGYDAARLTAYAGLVPEIQEKLLRTFADDLETTSGKVSLLLAVAMVKNDIAAGHADPALAQSLDRLANVVTR